MTIDVNGSLSSIQAPSGNPAGFEVMGHPHHIHSEGVQISGPLGFEIGDRCRHDVSKFIPRLNPSQGHGSQKSGALVSVSTGTVMSHASRVMGECASTLEGPCHIVNLP